MFYTTDAAVAIVASVFT